jgi:hypothetical protein
VLGKKCNESRRNLKTSCGIILVPLAFMIFGIWYSTFELILQSQSKVLSVEQYPLKQSVVINAEPWQAEESDVATSDLAKNLPMYRDAFTVQYSDAG